MSGFSIAWLDLREPADNAARDTALAKRALHWLQENSELAPIILDLGSGTGSTLRALTTLTDQNTFKIENLVWRLVDHDPALLNEALRRHGKTSVIEDYEADLLNLESLPLSGAGLVSASALFDLVSAQVVDNLLQRLCKQRSGFYAALNYDGRTQWTPTHPFDDSILHAFNKDQRRDKGLGPALGPESCNYLHSALVQTGYDVFVADSPWLLDGKNAALVEELINGIAAAVADDYGLDKNMLTQWQAFRFDNIKNGTCIVGHQDIFAIPAPTTAPTPAAQRMQQ